MKQKKGFLLIEAIIALLLVSLAFIMIAQIMSFAVDAQQKSQLRFTMLATLEYQQNLLISNPFDSPALTVGHHSRTEGNLTITWSVKDLSVALKEIDLAIGHARYALFKRSLHFYKSSILKENKYD